jgi:hypothetical protein
MITISGNALPSAAAFEARGFARLLALITEREAIRKRKEAGQPRPWTKYPILHEWSFTKIRRESGEPKPRPSRRRSRSGGYQLSLYSEG